MPQQPGPNVLTLLFPFLFMFGIFYLLVFRPQTKARQTHEQMLKGLKKHDEVATSGGLFGTVVNVKPETVTLRIDENVRVEVEKTAIVRLIKSRGGEDESATAERRA